MANPAILSKSLLFHDTTLKRITFYKKSDWRAQRKSITIITSPKNPKIGALAV
jgi:hypothetical protein